MKWGAVVVVVLATGAVCYANIAPIVYRGDPGYTQARAALWAAPVMMFLAAAFAVVWAVRAPSQFGRGAAVIFGLLVLMCAGLTQLQPETVFPDNEPDVKNPLGTLTRRPGSPRPTTREELAVGGIFCFTVVCFGGWGLVRFLATRSAGPPGSRPGG